MALHLPNTSSAERSFPLPPAFTSLKGERDALAFEVRLFFLKLSHAWAFEVYIAGSRLSTGHVVSLWFVGRARLLRLSGCGPSLRHRFAPLADFRDGDGPGRLQARVGEDAACSTRRLGKKKHVCTHTHTYIHIYIYIHMCVRMAAIIRGCMTLHRAQAQNCSP